MAAAQFVTPSALILIINLFVFFHNFLAQQRNAQELKITGINFKQMPVTVILN